MDATEQAEGEKRVEVNLIQPLLNRGLAKPSSLTKDQFGAMMQEMRSKLSYMSVSGLQALEEQAAAHPGGKDQDRMPIANNILKWAAEIEPPGDSASPLIRGVFASEVGKAAISEGWAPDLLLWLRKNRRWPNRFTAMSIKDAASEGIRRMTLINERIAAGCDLSPEDTRWRERRHLVLKKCEDIAALGQGARA